MKTLTWMVPLALAGCGTHTPTMDGGLVDQSVLLDGESPIDLAALDAEGCLASQPATQLYENPCPSGMGMFCFYDAPPSGFF